jgi:hypothetical protein
VIYVDYVNSVAHAKIKISRKDSKMDDETIINVSYLLIIGAFLITWKYSPLNPTFTRTYNSLVMKTNMFASYFIGMMMIICAIFMWIFIAIRR